MQLTRQAEYAIRTILELSMLPEGEFMQSRAIASRQKLPEQFLNKTVQILARTGLVETRRGAQGGIRLTVKPEEITIANVVTAVEGNIALNPCLADVYHCANQSTCRVHGILKRAQAAMLAELGRETFADLQMMATPEKSSNTIISGGM